MQPRDQQGVLLLRLALAQPFSDAVYRRRDDAGGSASGHTDDGAVGIAEFHDAHGVQTRLIGGPQINELSPLPQSLIVGGTGIGDTEEVVVPDGRPAAVHGGRYPAPAGRRPAAPPPWRR